MPSVYTVSREQFEQRMRLRRAATCLSVARSAIASGKMVEAVERLEEACALDPESGEARLLLEELRAQEEERRAQEPVEAGVAPVRVEHGRSEMAGWSHWVAAAIAICALATLAFFWPASPSGTDGSVEPARESPSAPATDPLPAATGSIPTPGLAAQLEVPADPVPGAIGTGGAAAASDAVRGAGGGSVAIRVTDEPVVQRPLPIVPPTGQQALVETDKAPGSPADPTQAVASPGTSASVLPRDTASSASARPSPLAQAETASLSGAGVAAAAGETAGTAPVPSPRPAPLPPLERVPVMEDTPAKPAAMLETELAPAAKAVAPAGASDAAEATLRVAPSDTREIEGTLRRYADAYARLDARAARAVWPTVDQRALARAFDGLQSQGITFEHCDVAVAGDEATAACSGRAQFVPKVGSREPLVERRQWNFRLRKADEGWQIMQAEAR